MANMKRTGSDTHVATQRGYAINSQGAGELVEPNEMVPADVPVSEEWMRPVKKSEAALLGAAEEATALKPKDVDLTKLDEPALQAMAAERGINVEQAGKKLNKKELIAAITAAHETDAG